MPKRGRAVSKRQQVDLFFLVLDRIVNLPGEIGVFRESAGRIFVYDLRACTVVASKLVSEVARLKLSYRVRLNCMAWRGTNRACKGQQGC